MWVPHPACLFLLAVRACKRNLFLKCRTYLNHSCSLLSLLFPVIHCNCLFATYAPLKLHQVLVQLQSGDKEQDFSLAPIQVSISVQLWRLPGCHEFLAALGEEPKKNLFLAKNNPNSLKETG